MPEMDGLQATKHIRSFESTGFWDASVKPEDDLMIADPAISSDCTHAKRQGQRVPIIAVSLPIHSSKLIQLRPLCQLCMQATSYICYFLNLTDNRIIESSCYSKLYSSKPSLCPDIV